MAGETGHLLMGRLQIAKLPQKFQRITEQSWNLKIYKKRNLHTIQQKLKMLNFFTNNDQNLTSWYEEKKHLDMMMPTSVTMI